MLFCRLLRQIFSCLFRLLLLTKCSTPHSRQGNGRSPVWTRMCRTMLLEHPDRLPHTSHLYTRRRRVPPGVTGGVVSMVDSTSAASSLSEPLEGTSLAALSSSSEAIARISARVLASVRCEALRGSRLGVTPDADDGVHAAVAHGTTDGEASLHGENKTRARTDTDLRECGVITCSSGKSATGENASSTTVCGLVDGTSASSSWSATQMSFGP